ncbi:siderophore-iron reductase FhuF [Pseudomonas sp. NPDC088368]|uniref:siderophore-iron reductase FhuF n=1 Tax=Pseudomonas sp. NPDC088368 TaxID=3364453 RepID=UPI0038004BF2
MIRAVIPALTPLFIGDFAHYRDVLVLDDDPRPSVPLRTFFTSGAFDDTLTRFGEQYPDSDRRGLASIWTKHYCVKLIPPVAAASLILDHRLPLDFADLQLMLDGQGMPRGFKLPDSGRRWSPEPADGFERFDDLIEHHLRPFIEGVTSRIRLSPHVLWSNAGNYFDWLLGVLAGEVPHAELRHGRDVLNAKTLPDGRRNPLYQPVRYLQVEGQTELKRQRRVCCVRYLVGGLAYCESCPVKHRNARQNGCLPISVGANSFANDGADDGDAVAERSLRE